MSRPAVTNQEIQAQVLDGGGNPEDARVWWSLPQDKLKDYIKIEANEPVRLTKIDTWNPDKPSYHAYFPNLNCCAYVQKYQLYCFDLQLVDAVDVWNQLNLN